MNAEGGSLMFIYQKYQMTDERCREIKGTGNMIILPPRSLYAGNLTFSQDLDNHELVGIRVINRFRLFGAFLKNKNKKNMLC